MAEQVTVVINGKEYVSKEARKAGNSIKGMGDETKRQSQSMQAGFAQVAASLYGAVKAFQGYFNVLGKGEQAITSLNAGIANVGTLIPGQTERLKEFRYEISNLSKSAGKSVTDLSGGLYQVISAIGDTSESMDVLDIATKAATAGLSSTTDSVTLLTGVAKGFGDTSSDMIKHIADLSFETVKLGVTTFPELAQNMGQVVPIGESLGASMEELFAVMATGTGVTGDTSRVATQLRSVMTGLAAPSKELSGLLDELGYSSGEALIKAKGLHGAISEVVKASESTGTPLQSYLGRVEAITLAQALAGTQADVYTEKLGKMENAMGAMDAAYAEQTTGLNRYGYLKQQMAQNIEAVYRVIGEHFLPTFERLTGALNVALSWFLELDDGVQNFIITIVNTGAVVGLAAVAYGALTTAVSAFKASQIAANITSAAALIKTGLLTGAKWLAFAAQMALNSAMAVMNPLLIAGIAATTAAVAGIVIYANKQKKAAQAIEETTQANEDLKGSLSSNAEHEEMLTEKALLRKGVAEETKETEEEISEELAKQISYIEAINKKREGMWNNVSSQYEELNAFMGFLEGAAFTGGTTNLESVLGIEDTSIRANALRDILGKLEISWEMIGASANNPETIKRAEVLREIISSALEETEKLLDKPKEKLTLLQKIQADILKQQKDRVEAEQALEEVQDNIIVAQKAGASSWLDQLKLAEDHLKKILGIQEEIAEKSNSPRALSTIIKDTYNDLKNWATNAFDFVKDISGTITDSLSGALSGDFSGIKSMASSAMQSADAAAPALLSGAATGLLSILTTLAGYFLNLVTSTEEFQAMISMINAVLQDAVVTLIGPLWSAIQPLVELVVLLASQVASMLIPVINMIGLVIQNTMPTFELLAEIIVSLIAAVMPLMPLVAMILEILIDGVTPVLSALVPLIDILASVISVVSPLFDVLAGAIKVLMTPIVTFGAALEWLMNMIHNVGQFIKNVIDHPFRSSKWDDHMKNGDLAGMISDAVNELWKDDSTRSDYESLIPSDFAEWSTSSDAMDFSSSAVNGGNTTIQQAPKIEVHLHYDTVIGDGGMERAGEVAVQAIEAYVGAGAQVEWVNGESA